MNSNKRHFLVVASASRGARFFIKKALEQGHDITALCRAKDDESALERMKKLLHETVITTELNVPNGEYGKLLAKNDNILEADTYAQILREDSSIDAICCFVGTTTFKGMRDKKNTLYSDTISAIVEGQKRSRYVETLYHGSVGSEGKPGESITKWPANYNPLSNIVQRVFPIFKDVTLSENILAEAKKDGLNFIIFRPSRLTNEPAKRKYGYSFNTTGMKKEDLPLKFAKRSIGREDTAEEILRVASLPEQERAKWYGNAVYLVDMKTKYFSK